MANAVTSPFLLVLACVRLPFPSPRSRAAHLGFFFFCACHSDFPLPKTLRLFPVFMAPRLLSCSQFLFEADGP